MKRLCFFTKHEISWGSSRERVGVYIDSLKGKGYKIEVVSVIPNRLSRIWIAGTGRRLFNRVYSFLYSRILKNLKFISLITKARRFDLILIQKVNLAYPLVWLLRARNRNIIFDFDDLCFELKGIFGCALEAPKVLSLYKHIIAGNSNLAELAIQAKGGESVTIIPTAIDCKAYPSRLKSNGGRPLVVGWAGSGENHLLNLGILVGPLKDLSQKYNFIFKLVGAMGSRKIKEMFVFLSDKFVAIDWVDNAELPRIIQTFDIGVMPLLENDNSRCKCGFKALQYMAAGAAAVISPVGVNSQIVDDGVNGLLAHDELEWAEKIASLICDSDRRAKLAQKARETVEEFYSLDTARKVFMEVVEHSAVLRK